MVGAAGNGRLARIKNRWGRGGEHHVSGSP